MIRAGVVRYSECSAAPVDRVAEGTVRFQLENSDWEHHQSQLSKENVPLPTEIFHRQCYVTTWFDKAGFKQRDFIGVDNILWQVGFPQSSSTYPDTAAAVQENLGELPADERDRIVHGNAAKLYGVG